MRFFILFFISTCFVFASCQKTKKDEVLETFAKKALTKGFQLDSVYQHDMVYLSKNGLQFKVTLKNLRQQFAVSPHEKTISEFVELVDSSNKRPPEWKISKENIFNYLYTSNYDFKHFIHENISTKLSKIYVYSENGKLSWISTEDLQTWKITNSDLEAKAQENNHKLIDEMKFEVDSIYSHPYIAVETNRPSFASSIVLSKELKAKIQQQLAWPVLAIVPCRDQCYFFKREDEVFVKNKLKDFVNKKYAESNDPLSKEILEISDNGIKKLYEF